MLSRRRIVGSRVDRIGLPRAANGLAVVREYVDVETAKQSKASTRTCKAMPVDAVAAISFVFMWPTQWQTRRAGAECQLSQNDEAEKGFRDQRLTQIGGGGDLCGQT